MPRIRRWFNCSHDINRDREVQELRRRFGDWMGFVWLEMLAEADKKEGRVTGTKEQIAQDLSWIALNNRPTWGARRILQAIPFMEEKGWIKDTGNGHFIISNYVNYLPGRARKKFLKGTVKNSPPPEPPKPLSLTWPTDLLEVKSLLEELGIELYDIQYWRDIEAYVKQADESGVKIYWLDEFRKYVMECVKTRKPGKRPHKDLKRGFWNWIKNCERWERERAEKAKFRDSRPRS